MQRTLYGTVAAVLKVSRYDTNEDRKRKRSEEAVVAAANGEGKWNFSLLNGASQRVPCPHAREVA